jgi:hypothetical protein
MSSFIDSSKRCARGGNVGPGFAAKTRLISRSRSSMRLRRAAHAGTPPTSAPTRSAVVIVKLTCGTAVLSGLGSSATPFSLRSVKRRDKW